MVPPTLPLELAAMGLLALAAATPLVIEHRVPRRVVLILDNSYSMTAGDALDRGRHRARELASSADEVGFVLAGATPSVVASGAPGGIDAALEAWSATEASSDLAGAISIARQSYGAGAQLVVLSDTPADTLGIDVEREPGVRWVALGEPSNNVAFVNAQRRGGELLLQIANLSDTPETVQLSIVGGTGEPASRDLELAPNQVTEVRTSIDPELDAVCTIEGTGIAADDTVRLPPTPQRTMRAAVRVRDDQLASHLGRALEATDRVGLAHGATPELVFAESAPGPSDGEADPEVAWRVIFEPPGDDAGVFIGPYTIDPSHPVADGLDLAGVVWPASTEPTEISGVPVVMLDRTALIEEVVLDGLPTLVVRIDTARSNLFQTPAWPTLVWNIVSWRRSALAGPARVAFALGEMIEVTPGIDGEVVHTDPAGVVRRLRGTGRLSIPARTPGEHTLSIDGVEHRVAVNTLDAGESDLRGLGWGEVRGPEAVAETASLSRSLAPMAAIAVLAVLAVHAWLISPRGRNLR